MSKLLATHRQIEGFCPNGHRLPKVTIAVESEQTVTCKRCGERRTFRVTRNGDSLKVEG